MCVCACVLPKYVERSPIPTKAYNSYDHLTIKNLRHSYPPHPSACYPEALLMRSIRWFTTGCIDASTGVPSQDGWSLDSLLPTELHRLAWEKADMIRPLVERIDPLRIIGPSKMEEFDYVFCRVMGSPNHQELEISWFLGEENQWRRQSHWMPPNPMGLACYNWEGLSMSAVAREQQSS